MAGGIVGGMIGGMLFRSLGFAGGGASGAGTGGGIGMMDILLIGALLYGIYWFIKRRRKEATASAPAGTFYRESSAPDAGQTTLPLPAYEPDRKTPSRQALATSVRWIPILMKNVLPTVAWTSSS